MTRRTTSPESSRAIPSSRTATPTSIIRWGVTHGSAERLRLHGSVPAAASFPVARGLFRLSLGSFMHRNFAVDDPSLTSVQLDVFLVISVDGVPRPPLTFTYTFNHVETPNKLDPCPFDPTPPPDGCSDRVSIVASAHAHDVQRRWSGLHVGDELSRPQRQSGLPVHHERRRRHQYHGPGRAIHAAARHAGDHGRQVGPGEAEAGGVRAISPSTCKTPEISTRSTLRSSIVCPIRRRAACARRRRKS